MELMLPSPFLLILRGDAEFSYRFNEVVSSRGILVLVADQWVTAFNELVPVESYEIFIKESEVTQLLAKLKSNEYFVIEGTGERFRTV